MFAEGYTYNPFQDEEGTYCQDENPTCIIVAGRLPAVLPGRLPLRRRRRPGPRGRLDLPRRGDDRAVRSAEPDVQRARLGPERRLRVDAAGDLVGPRPADYPLFADSAAAAEWIRPFASPFDPHDGRLVPVGGRDRRRVQAAAEAVHACRPAEATFKLCDVVRPRAGLRLHVRRDPHRRRRRLDHARGREREHVRRRRAFVPVGEPGLGLAVEPPVPGALPDEDRQRQRLRPDRHAAASGTRRPATPAAGRNGRMPIPAAYHGENVEISVSVVERPGDDGPRHVGRRARASRTARGAPINSADPSFESGMDGWTRPGRPRPRVPAASPRRPAGSARRAHRSWRRRSRPPTTPSTPASGSRP